LPEKCYLNQSVYHRTSALDSKAPGSKTDGKVEEGDAAKTGGKADGDTSKTDRDAQGRRGENNKENRRSRSTSPRNRRRRGDRSPTPKPLRIHIGRLTRNVTKDHLTEIFSAYGSVKMVEMSKERGPAFSHLHRGFAYVEYATAEEAETAMKHMDGGSFHYLRIF